MNLIICSYVCGGGGDPDGFSKKLFRPPPLHFLLATPLRLILFLSFARCQLEGDGLREVGDINRDSSLVTNI